MEGIGNTTNRMQKERTEATRTKRPAAGKSKARAVSSRERVVVTAEERGRMIAEAAYYRAERRGFSEEGAEGDWYEAEREIDARIAVQEE